MKEEDEEKVMAGEGRIKCNVLSSLVCHSMWVCLYAPYYTKSSKQSHVTKPWLLLPHSWSFLSCICIPVSASTLPCDGILQTLSIMGLPSGYTSRSAKPCSWAHSPAAPLSLDLSPYLIHWLHPWAHRAAQHCFMHLRWRDLSSLCARPWQCEWALVGTNCSIHFCFLLCEFFDSWLNNIKNTKLCLTKRKTSKTHQFVPLGAEGIASAVESDETEQGLLFWQKKPGRAQKLMKQEELIFQVRKGK